MKNKSLITILLLFVIAALGYYFLKGNSSQEEKVKVTINSWVGFGPLFVAQEVGLFEKSNLNIEIIKLEDAPDRRAALLSDRVQIVGSTLDDLAVSLSQGIDAVAISCADYSNGGDAIIAKKSIKSLDTIPNFAIAVQPGFVNHFFLLYVLKQNGILADSLKIKPMKPDDAGAAFIAGNIDVAVTWQPHIYKAVESPNGCNILASSNDYPEAILDIFIAKRDWVKNNPEFVTSFRRSWDEALIYMENNKEKANNILAKDLGLSPDDVGAMLLDLMPLSSQAGQNLVLPKIDNLSKDVEEIWKKAGYLEKDIDLKNSIMLN